jgi:flavin reductase (DIM6/NTAB) family NADH-FMN oxidoreductase RutF
MVETSRSVPHGIDEFEISGLTKRASHTVKVPAVAESPAHLECKLFKTMELPPRSDENYILIFGEVTGIYIADNIIQDGMVDFMSVGRLGYQDYSIINNKQRVVLKK